MLIRTAVILTVKMVLRNGFLISLFFTVDSSSENHSDECPSFPPKKLHYLAFQFQ